MVDHHWQKISKDAKDLITKLLTKHPQQRITCELAMKHAWFESIREQLVLDNAAKSQNKFIMLGNSDSASVQALYPDSMGGSVKDIKPYAHITDEEIPIPSSAPPLDESDSDSDVDAMQRMVLVKQNSVLDI